MASVMSSTTPERRRLIRSDKRHNVISNSDFSIRHQLVFGALIVTGRVLLHWFVFPELRRHGIPYQVGGSGDHRAISEFRRICLAEGRPLILWHVMTGLLVVLYAGVIGWGCPACAPNLQGCMAARSEPANAIPPTCGVESCYAAMSGTPEAKRSRKPVQLDHAGIHSYGSRMTDFCCLCAAGIQSIG